MNKNLNDGQNAAVNSGKGAVLVLAGAGTGKTTVITHRVLKLLQDGVNPYRILAVTFTRKAANEMNERISNLGFNFGEKKGLTWCGTFHALGLRFLSLQNDKNFSVLDEQDAIDLMHRAMEESGYLCKKKDAAEIVNAISYAKNSGKAIIDAFREFGIKSTEEESGKLYDIYQNRKYERKLRDFDDLLIDWCEALKNVNRTGQKFFDYILVDEYQDINCLQENIIIELSKQTSNLMVVGDDAQSIYGFRGSCVDNIISFQHRYENCKVVKLEENYRSVQPILDLSNELWKDSQEGLKKDLFSFDNQKLGTLPILQRCSTENEQVSTIIKSIKNSVNSGMKLREQAVLFRSAYHAIKLELELRKARISYKKYGGRSIADAAHIKDLQAILRTLCSREDEVAWIRVFKLLPKIGEKTANRMFLKILNSKKNDSCFRNFSEKEKDSLGKFVELFTEEEFTLVENDLSQEAPIENVRKAYEFYLPILEENYDNAEDRKKELEIFIEGSKDYKSLREFLNAYFLDEEGFDKQSSDDDFLTLSTVHSAKGLEWKKVLIINLVERSFPSARSVDGGNLEEERRLMYVAFTRAKEILELYLPEKSLLRKGDCWIEIKNEISSFLTANVLNFVAEKDELKSQSSLYNFRKFDNLSSRSQTENYYDFDDK